MVLARQYIELRPNIFVVYVNLWTYEGGTLDKRSGCVRTLRCPRAWYPIVPAHSCRQFCCDQPTETDRNEVICLPNVVCNSYLPSSPLFACSQLSTFSPSGVANVTFGVLHHYSATTFLHTSPRKRSNAVPFWYLQSSGCWDTRSVRSRYH